MEKFCCVRLNLSGGFRGVVGIVSFSVDFNIRSDPVVIGLAGLESFAVGIACLRCFEVRLCTIAGVFLRGSEDFISIYIHALRRCPGQVHSLLTILLGDFLGFCTEVALADLFEGSNGCFFFLLSESCQASFLRPFGLPLLRLPSSLL